MKELFYVDPISGNEYSYEKLVSDISSCTHYNKYCKSDSFYEIFKHIIISLLYGEEIILLDSDFSISEINSLLGSDSIDLTSSKNLNVSKLDSLSELYVRIKQNSLNFKITLFTSGTTGIPKKVTHSYMSMTRFVKNDMGRRDDIWGFAYNPTHMAGLQVFFQAFLNQNIIVRLFGMSREKIVEAINSYNVTNLSATPTFYRLLLPANFTCNTVKKLTSGGEKFDEHTSQQLQLMFPNSSIRNVYASTEAGTIMASHGTSFKIRTDMEKLLKVINNEIYLHVSLLGDTSSWKSNDEWYATGDIVEVENKEPLIFKFISRKNEFINTGGYKVNPIEVEDAIRKCDNVKDVYVFGKKNSLLGNIVCCEVVKTDESLTEREIYDFLKDKLQQYKIPRLIYFVDNLTLTRTGKISRN